VGAVSSRGTDFRIIQVTDRTAAATELTNAKRGAANILADADRERVAASELRRSAEAWPTAHEKRAKRSKSMKWLAKPSQRPTMQQGRAKRKAVRRQNQPAESCAEQDSHYRLIRRQLAWAEATALAK